MKCIQVCRDNEGEQVNRSGTYIITPVGGDKWVFLWVNYWLVDATDSFQNGESLSNETVLVYIVRFAAVVLRLCLELFSLNQQIEIKLLLVILWLQSKLLT